MIIILEIERMPFSSPLSRFNVLANLLRKYFKIRNIIIEITIVIAEIKIRSTHQELKNMGVEFGEDDDV